MDLPEIPRPSPDVQDDRFAGMPIVPGAADAAAPLDAATSIQDEVSDAGPFDVVVIEDKPPTGHRWSILFASLLSALLTAALTVGTLYVFGAFDVEPNRIETIVQQQAPQPAGAEVGLDIVALVAERAIPSIVTVHRFDNLIELGPAGSGSGVIFRSDGYVLTNDHVIANARSIKVVLADGLTYPAQLVGTDPLMDVAVLKIDVEGLAPIAFGDIGQSEIGDLAIAVGNPLGLDGGPSVTSGVISAFDRTLTTNGLGGTTNLYGLLQTDAPITRGSSGGALLDREGRLLGITTAIGVSDVGAEGLGFAVPVNLVRVIAGDLINQGSVQHAFLGIRGESALVERDDGSEVPLGAEISVLLAGSAIGNAGAQVGDVIVALDGEPVNSMILLVARLRSYRAGDSIIVTVSRGGENIDVPLVLDQFPSS